MADTNKNYASLSEEEKAAFKASLKETEEILDLQAKIAIHRANIQVSKLNELTAFLQLNELSKPSEKPLKPEGDGK